MASSLVTRDEIEDFDLGPYWEEHKETLGELSKSDMPSKAIMKYNEIIAEKHNETNNLLLKYGIINFSNSGKNLLRINVEMTPDFVIKREEIIFSDGNINQAKRTIVNDDNAIHDGHRKWLKNLYENHYAR
jgi:hypothetical protein